MAHKNETLANRLGDILCRLNAGETLSIKSLSDEFGVSERTLRRDLNERLGFLQWNDEQCKKGLYCLELNQLGRLEQKDIERFARFASVQNLFPKIDREFYTDNLEKSIKVKGYQYEDIHNKSADFINIKNAIENHHEISFFYARKHSGNIKKEYTVQPYKLINRQGFWFLIALHNSKEKTFYFNQISSLRCLKKVFSPSEKFVEQIACSDSISHGNQEAVIKLQVSATVAHYFERSKLLPNQRVIEKDSTGNLLVECEKVHPMEVIPVVQYWLPHIKLLYPKHLADTLIDNLKKYLHSC